MTDNRKSCFGSEVLECKWEDQLWAKQKWVDFQLLETFLKSSHLPVFAGGSKLNGLVFESGNWKPPLNVHSNHLMNLVHNTKCLFDV